jgi:oligo-1,6-glucosidase
MLNFTSKNATANIGINTANAKVLINNYPIASKSLELRPYEAVVLELK